MVQVHHEEGMATHLSPGSCACIRENVSEASTVERTGQPLPSAAGQRAAWAG